MPKGTRGKSARALFRKYLVMGRLADAIPDLATTEAHLATSPYGRPLCSFELASQMLFRTRGRTDKSAFARSHAAHLEDGIFLDLYVVRNVCRFSVEAAGWQYF